MNVVERIYDGFDDWTKRTGILDGSGLTWIARIPLNILFAVTALIVGCIIAISNKKEEYNANKQR